MSAPSRVASAGRNARRATVALALASLVATPALGCGVCVEDKIAVTYDHAVVTRAAQSGQLVVFAGVEGSGGKRLRARLERAARQVDGIDRASIRVAADPAALSFAVDAKVRTPDQAMRAIEQRTGPPGVRLTLLRVVQPDAQAVPR